MTPPCTILDHKNGFLEEFLLCDEVWDMSPLPSANHHHPMHYSSHDHIPVHPITKQDYNHSFHTYLRKEIKYMTGSGYIKLLQSNQFVANCRLKAIQWFIHSRRRFNFGYGTLFNAVNYVDRFIDSNRCKGWSYSMMEMVFLASLCIAMKFGETCPPSLHEIQEGLDNCFEAKLIQRMELKILKSLNWELNSITPFSYVELVTWELNSTVKPYVLDELISRMNEVLVASALDIKLLVYLPSVITMSALRCVLDDQHCLSNITIFIPPADQEQNLQCCYKMMKEKLGKFHEFEVNGNPSSPDTVLTKEQVVIYEEQVDLSLIDGPSMKNDLKRKKEQDDDYDRVVKHKNCM